MQRISSFVLIAFGLVAGWCPFGMADDDAGREEIFSREVQAIGQAWQFSGVDLPEGCVATISASGDWKINPLWSKNVGAGGNARFTGDQKYVKIGANEGCLLVRTGDSVYEFSKDDDVIEISTPGKIYFCANDLPNEAGAERAKDYIAALPIPSAEGVIGAGFMDNRGHLTVRLAVKRAGK